MTGASVWVGVRDVAGGRGGRLPRRGAKVGSRSALLALAVLAGLLALPVGEAVADAPGDITIVPQGKANYDGEFEVGSRQPTIVVQVSLAPTGASEARCTADYSTSYVDAVAPVFGSCGTPMAACPVDRCWEYRPTFAADGAHNVGVALFDPSGEEVDFLGADLTVDSTPPDTSLAPGPPSINDAEATRTRVPVSVEADPVDEGEEVGIFDGSLQCAFSGAATAPRTWGPCLGKAMWLPISAKVYRLWVRAVDFLGRPDPTPAVSAPFSPLPCRSKPLGHPTSLRQIARRGLRVRVTCVQPITYKLVLYIPLKELVRLNRAHHEIGSQQVGIAAGRTRGQGASRVVTIHLLRRIPRALFAIRNLSLSLETVSATNLPLELPHVLGR